MKFRTAAALIGPIIFVAAVCASAATHEHFERTLTAAAGGKLVLDVDFGEIEVRAAANDQVRVDAQREIDLNDERKEREFLDAAPITLKQEGSTITIRARRADGGGFHWHGHVEMDARYIVQVPASFDTDLRTGGGQIAISDLVGTTKVDTGGGRLTFRKLRGSLNAKTSGGSVQMTACDGPLNVTTSGGQIEVAGGSGRIDAHTSGGSIAVQDFSGDTNVATSGGRLALVNINGQITGRTSGGSVRAMLAAPVPGDVHLETSAGSIDIAVPPTAGLNVDARASVGRIETDLPFVGDRSKREALRGTINGGGKALRLRSDAGSIHIHSACTSPGDKT